ncbi:MAG: hypothetical protein WD232_01360 [Acidimicrobiales bacterium]
MSDHPLLCRVEADRQGATESDGGEGDLGHGDSVTDRAVSLRRFHQPAENVLCGSESIGPRRGSEQCVHDIDRPEAGVDGSVHVSAQRLAASVGLVDGRPSFVDGSVEHVECHRTKKALLIGEVPVQGGDAHAGAMGDRVPGGLPAKLEDQLDRCVEKPSPVSSSVGPHRLAAAA